MKFDARTMTRPTGVSTASETVLRLLSEHGPMTRHEIERAIGRSALDGVIDKLRTKSMVRPAGDVKPGTRMRPLEITRLGLQRINAPVSTRSAEGRITNFNKLTYNPADFAVRGRVGLAVYQ